MFANHVVLSAILRGQKMERNRIDETLRKFSAKRWASQPAQPSAGCIFKNPAVIPAGRLIEELGLKGQRVGGAKVSEVHGNFIVNEGGATAADVVRLIGQIREERGNVARPEYDALHIVVNAHDLRLRQLHASCLLLRLRSAVTAVRARWS